VPRFLIEKEIGTTAAHFSEIMGDGPSTAPFGIFWTWGGHPVGAKNFDRLTKEKVGETPHDNLYEKRRAGAGGLVGGRPYSDEISCFSWEV
jgi:hypothetical protein